MERQSQLSSFPPSQQHPTAAPSTSAPVTASSSSPPPVLPNLAPVSRAVPAVPSSQGASPVPIPHLAPASTLLSHTHAHAHSAPSVPVPHHHHQAAVAAAAAAAAAHHHAAAASHAHHMLAAAATAAPNNYYEAYIGTLEHNRRLQATLDSSRLENERLRERLITLEKISRPEPPKAQSRYWTPDEHQRFLDALQEYGPKDVRSIASYVGSRNPTQVRTHAQKYFLRKQREASKGLVASRKRSMSESDLARVDRLHAAVPTSGTPPPSPPPRFPLPKPPFNTNSTTTSTTNSTSKIDGQEAALLLQLADARENAVRYKCALENKEIECEDLRQDLDRLPPPSAIVQQPVIPRRHLPSEFPPPRPPRQTKMEIDP